MENAIKYTETIRHRCRQDTDADKHTHANRHTHTHTDSYRDTQGELLKPEHCLILGGGRPRQLLLHAPAWGFITQPL